jgi:DnaA family protein
VQRQLTLDLGTPPPATFDNFFATGNHELVTRLRELEGALAAGPVADRTFYIWGDAGSGRSHLLQALVHEASGRARFLSPQSALNAFTFDPRVTLYAVDDCDALSGAQQIALFNLFNEVRAHPVSALVATGNAAPMGLAVREDLRTRLGWGLVFQLAALTDEAKVSVLRHAARERGIVLADDVPAYLLTHFRRDMPSLMALFDELDRFSLERKSAVTLALLRKMLQRTSGAPALTLVGAEQGADDAEAASAACEDESTETLQKDNEPDPADPAPASATPSGACEPDAPTDLFGNPLSPLPAPVSPDNSATRFK